MNLRSSASTWAGGDADLAWAWTYSPTMVESRAETMLSCFGVTKILVTHMPQTKTPRTMRPTSICTRVKPPKNSRLALRAGCGAGFSRPISVYSALIGFPFRPRPVSVLLSPPDDQLGLPYQVPGRRQVRACNQAEGRT